MSAPRITKVYGVRIGDKIYWTGKATWFGINWRRLTHKRKPVWRMYWTSEGIAYWKVEDK